MVSLARDTSIDTKNKHQSDPCPAKASQFLLLMCIFCERKNLKTTGSATSRPAGEPRHAVERRDTGRAGTHLALVGPVVEAPCGADCRSVAHATRPPCSPEGIRSGKVSLRWHYRCPPPMPSMASPLRIPHPLRNTSAKYPHGGRFKKARPPVSNGDPRATRASGRLRCADAAGGASSRRPHAAQPGRGWLPAGAPPLAAGRGRPPPHQPRRRRPLAPYPCRIVQVVVSYDTRYRLAPANLPPDSRPTTSRLDPYT